MFDLLAGKLIPFAKARGITINMLGDWSEGGKGRTLELGARSSVVRLVIYEKGYQIGLENGGDPDHVRMEVRVRPKHNKHEVAKWAPEQCFAAAKWVRDALEELGWQTLQAQAAIGTIRKPTDDEKSRIALINQYGAILDRWLSEAGSWEELGTQIKALKERGNQLYENATQSA
jgi:hypothetical protein